MDFVVPVVIFVLCLFLFETAYYFLASVRQPGVKKVRKRLRSVSMQREISQGGEPIDIVRRRYYSEIPWLNKLIAKSLPLKKLDILLLQANVEFSLGFFLLLMLLLFFTGYMLGSLMLGGQGGIPFILGLPFAYLPFLYIQLKRSERMKKFERQLPDAMELVARALRAGHAFSSGMRLVVDQFDDPVGTEFERTLDEINFGVPTDVALTNLSTRIDCPDLKFFTIAVIIQRDVGGNLAEIIENMARLIRERFKFQGHVRILSAEGRMSATVISLLPFAVTAAMYFLNPEFILTLAEDPAGRTLVGITLCLMAVGIFTMFKMIKIEV